jgi:hypothetical protein
MRYRLQMAQDSADNMYTHHRTYVLAWYNSGNLPEAEASLTTSFPSLLSVVGVLLQ